MMGSQRIDRSLDGAGALARRAERGFSLVELMVTIGILAILLGMAAWSYSEWRTSTALTTATETFLAHLRQARLTAIAESRSVKIDFPDNASYVLDPDDRNLTVRLSEYSPELRVHQIAASAAPATVSFTSRGTSSNWGCVFEVGGRQKKVHVNALGRAYVE